MKRQRPNTTTHTLFTFLNSPSRRSDHAPVSCRTPAARGPDSHLFARKRSRAACACAGLGGLCGSLFGIAPFCGEGVSWWFSHQSIESCNKGITYLGL